MIHCWQFWVMHLVYGHFDMQNCWPSSWWMTALPSAPQPLFSKLDWSQIYIVFWLTGLVSGSVDVTLRMVATTSLSFSLQRSFWTQKSSCCSSCLSAGRRSEERNLGNNWHSLYLTDRWWNRQTDGCVTYDVRKTDFTCLIGQNSHKTTWHWRRDREPAPVQESGSVCWSIFLRKSQWLFHKHQGTSDGSSSSDLEPDLKIKDIPRWTISDLTSWKGF